MNEEQIERFLTALERIAEWLEKLEGHADMLTDCVSRNEEDEASLDVRSVE